MPWKVHYENLFCFGSRAAAPLYTKFPGTANFMARDGDHGDADRGSYEDALVAARSIGGCLWGIITLVDD